MNYSCRSRWMLGVVLACCMSLLLSCQAIPPSPAPVSRIPSVQPNPTAMPPSTPPMPSLAPGATPFQPYYPPVPVLPAATQTDFFQDDFRRTTTYAVRATPDDVLRFYHEWFLHSPDSWTLIESSPTTSTFWYVPRSREHAQPGIGFTIQILSSQAGTTVFETQHRLSGPGANWGDNDLLLTPTP